ncbi:tail protein [Neorhizobium galegae]|uniref:Tail tubular protein A n=2 Tax=Neorhizobium galegae TaxID=399 RepID=A0A068SMQ9_NEOGA|nr:tail protein [Neorhizobium galegae]CDN47567.1 Tail tubular protein A [Neorhizobium galegae bv. orientalis str. HAMBI 540]
MLADTPTTVLEAVNQIIATIGEPPVNSVEDSGVIDAVMALQALSAVNRAVQLKGWHWNTEEDYPIAPSYPEGEIKLPRNALKVDTTGADKSLDLVVRGQRLYDRRNHTFEIGKTVKVEIVFLLPFEELPEAARTYITIKAGRRFQEGQIGSELLSNFSLRDEQMALFALEDAEGETADLNILDNSFIGEVTSR